MYELVCVRTCSNGYVNDWEGGGIRPVKLYVSTTSNLHNKKKVKVLFHRRDRASNDNIDLKYIAKRHKKVLNDVK